MIDAKNRFKKLTKSFAFSRNLNTFALGQTKVLFVVYLLSSFYIQQAVALGKAAAFLLPIGLAHKRVGCFQKQERMCIFWR